MFTQVYAACMGERRQNMHIIYVDLCLLFMFLVSGITIREGGHWMGPREVAFGIDLFLHMY